MCPIIHDPETLPSLTPLSQTISINTFLMLSSNLHLDLPSSFPGKILYAFLVSLA
jgi:hypothetical protein